ncbi:MAG: glycosyltransferase family 4 protein [Phycisphaeraceae bacterium]|nr:glycosyltransferase family 4 protein [Phycisphaeraceae bacterium]
MSEGRSAGRAPPSERSPADRPGPDRHADRPTRPLRILLVNQVFWPDVAATAQHADDLARHLVARGHQVQVIASRSIYWAGSGHRSLLPAREEHEGIEITRVGRSIFGRRSNLARAADFALFYVAAMTRALFVKRPDVVICFTTPPLIGLVGRMLRALRGVRFIYWVMDLYPDLPVACGVLRRGGLAARFFERVHRGILRSADAVVVLGRCMQRRVLEKGIDPSRVRIIHVWSDSEELGTTPHRDNAFRREWALDGAFTVMYAGNYGVGHDVATMLGAAKILRDREDIRFVFAGGGARKREVEGFISEHQLTNAQSQPYQPRERLGELLSAADVHLASQAADMAGLFVPSKLFGIMAAARPAIFVGNADAENALVLGESGCGWVIAPGDAVGLASLLRELAADPERCRSAGERGRDALALHYSRADGCRQWHELIESNSASEAAQRVAVGPVARDRYTSPPTPHR